MKSMYNGGIRFPELSGKGSYSDEATYSHADVARVIEYARVRAVRVMPEFEVPAHSGWGYGRPSVVACPLWRDFRLIFEHFPTVF